MKASKYNKSEIMKNAHNLYKFNKSFGWSFSRSLSLAWSNAKQAIVNAEVEARNEAIRAMWKAQAEAKRMTEIEAERARFEASGMDLHTYAMISYYGERRYYGD